MRPLLICGAALALPSSLLAQSFVNGTFTKGTLNGWAVVNTPNGVGAPGSVTSMDIDGPGPLGISNAATFMVGLQSFQPASEGGIDMYQGLSLTGGQSYEFSFDWSAQRTIGGPNSEGGIFSLTVDGTVIATQAAGEVSTGSPVYGHFQAVYTPPATASYAVGLRITRPFVSPGDLSQYVDNITVTLGTAPCYANCDASSGSPLLTANDFTCFVNAFATGQSYANCDQSTGTPTLTGNDFVCFINAYATGCT